MRKTWTTGTLVSFSKPATTAFCLFMALSSSMNSWGQAPPGENTSAVLGQLATAFSGTQVVQQIQLSGTATWTAGSSEDSGPVTLTASTNGSSQMQFALGSTGARTETQTGAGSSADCQWAGADGIAHEVSVGNCLKPMFWFLPALSLQPSLVPRSLSVVDLGAGTVGASSNIYRHLQSQLLVTALPDSLATNNTQEGIGDLGLDPVSFLPAVQAYSLLPDNGAPIPIAIEIHYSNYKTVDGVQIPLLIQRYVNGSLQIAIIVSSAQIN